MRGLLSSKSPLVCRRNGGRSTSRTTATEASAPGENRLFAPVPGCFAIALLRSAIFAVLQHPFCASVIEALFISSFAGLNAPPNPPGFA